MVAEGFTLDTVVFRVDESLMLDEEVGCIVIDDSLELVALDFTVLRLVSLDVLDALELVGVTLVLTELDEAGLEVLEETLELVDVVTGLTELDLVGTEEVLKDFELLSGFEVVETLDVVDDVIGFTDDEALTEEEDLAVEVDACEVLVATVLVATVLALHAPVTDGTASTPEPIGTIFEPLHQY